MLKFIIRFFVILIFNYLILIFSENIDVGQVKYDLEASILLRPYRYNLNVIYLIICITITIATLSVIRFFKPFMEIYLIYYMKINFYFFSSLISISTIYLILRVYGYSRILILGYLLLTSLTLIVTDKIKS
jgi:hypothetical protein